jgi:hypothetical protein
MPTQYSVKNRTRSTRLYKRIYCQRKNESDLKCNASLKYDFSGRLSQCSVYLFALNRSSRRNHGTFRNYDHAISNVIVFAIRILRFTLRRNHHPVPDARVLIDNGALNAAIASDAKCRDARLRLSGFCLVKVGPHKDRVADRGAAPDHAPNPDDRAADVRVANDTAISHR